VDLTFPARELIEATKGRLAGGNERRAFDSISTDTRKIKAGQLFVALSGDKHDGHGYLGQAVAAGAKGLVVAYDQLSKLPTIDLGDEGVTVISVEDTLKAYGDIARFHRSRLPVPTVCVTGSNGKTATKELIAAILGAKGKVLKTPKNHNNRIGVPQTLLALDTTHEYAVIECGTSEPGEIAQLARICGPDVGVLTNISPAHTSGLANVEGIAKEKGALYEALPESGAAIVNLDVEWCVAQSIRSKGRRITFGEAEAADVRVKEYRLTGASPTISGTVVIEGQEIDIETSLIGNFQIRNAAAAIAVGMAMGVPPREAARALLTVQPELHRMEYLETRGIHILDDTYNANPASTLQALETLDRCRNVTRGKGRTVAILGDMLDLGVHSVESHRLIGRRAADLKLDVLIGVGEGMRDALDAAKEKGLRGAARIKDAESAAAQVGRQLRQGDWVLVKGSRAMEMDRVVEALTTRSVG
jgi:UDP-N-acetylmuramoyl-tripeptide--D-alanyl-D-alanine ligase